MSAADEVVGGRIAEIVAAVSRQALRDCGVRRIALLDDGSPEAVLAGRWLSEALPGEALLRVSPDPAALESVLRIADARHTPENMAEARSLFARLIPDSLPAVATNKTVLLLSGPLPPEPLLPLGDLYASEVRSLAEGWSAPAPVRELADRAGGVDRLDAALRDWFDGRDPEALERLPDSARHGVRAALARGAASRVGIRVVPKIGYRTLGLDLFE